MNQEIEGSTAVYKRKNDMFGTKIFLSTVKKEYIDIEINMMKRIPSSLFIHVPIYSWKYPTLMMRHGKGMLLNYIKEIIFQKNADQIIQRILEVVSFACMHLNSLGITHGDLALKNIVYFDTIKNAICPNFYLVDWGLSHSYMDDSYETMRNNCVERFENHYTKSNWEAYSTTYFRCPLKKHLEYDWFYFLNNLFINFPSLQNHSFFTPETFVRLAFYKKYYRHDQWS